MDLDAYGISTASENISKGLMEALAKEKEVVLKAGTYLSGPIKMPSDSHLVLEEGAVIRFVPDFSLYPPVKTRWEGVRCWAMHPCIFIDGAENVSISGHGTIDGSGKDWWNVVRDKRARGVKAPETEIEKAFAELNPDYKEQPGGGGGRDYQFLRPALLQIKDSKHIRVEGVKLTNSPFWTVHPLCSEDVTIDSIRVVNPYDAPNTDGIDIESSSNVKVTGCYVDVGDDGIALKSGSGEDGIKANVPAKNVLISKCSVRSAHGGAVIGSETAAEIANITVEDCIFDGTDRGIRIKSRRGRGGHIHDIAFRRIKMIGNLCPFVINMYYRCGTDDASLFSLDPQPVNPGTPRIYNVVIEECVAEGCRASAGMIAGLPESPVKGVSIRSSRFSVAENADRDPSESDMYNGLPDPPSRGFRIRNASVELDDLAVESDEPKIIVEDGVEVL